MQYPFAYERQDFNQTNSRQDKKWNLCFRIFGADGYGNGVACEADATLKGEANLGFPHISQQ